MPSKHHKAITQSSIRHWLDPSQPSHQCQGSPQIGSQWILILVSIIPDHSQKAFVNHHRDDLDADVVWTLLSTYLLCVDRFDQFQLPRAILVNLEEGGTFAWVLLRLNVIFWWYLKTMIIRFKSAREITNKVTDNKILLQIAFQVLLRFLPRRTRRGSISIWCQPCLN